MTIPKPADDATIVDRLGYALAILIRATDGTWHLLEIEEQRACVSRFQLLRDAQRAITGKHETVIPSPWTYDEIAESLGLNCGGYYSVGSLNMQETPLVGAVRLTERSLRRYGRLPATLNFKYRPHNLR